MKKQAPQPQKKVYAFNANTFKGFLLMVMSVIFSQISQAQWVGTSPVYYTGGNVGIGTSGPNNKLEVIGVTKIAAGPSGSGLYLDASAMSTNNNYSNVRIRAGNDGSSGFLKNSLDNWGGYFSWEVGSSNGNVELMRINATTGKVGIGAASPRTKLEVGGEIMQTARTTYLWGANANESQALMFAGWGGAHGGIYWRGDSKTFTLNTGDDCNNSGQYGDANLSVTGNVGIGTTNTYGYKLAVNGSAIFTEARVKLYGNWPDYVFGEKHNLLPLKDLEKYISANNHLPNIPSAAEVQKDGINLGEMNAKLLEKIEELTLYIIELKKDIERLEKSTKKLKQ